MTQYKLQFQKKFNQYKIFVAITFIFGSIFSYLLNTMFSSDFSAKPFIERYIEFTKITFDPNKILLTSLLYTSVLLFMIFVVLVFVWKSLLVHSLFTYLKKEKNSKINPDFAVWTIFIPYFATFKHPYNLLKASKQLGVKNTFYTTFYLFFGSMFLIIQTLSEFVKLMPIEVLGIFATVAFFIDAIAELKVFDDIKNSI